MRRTKTICISTGTKMHCNEQDDPELTRKEAYRYTKKFTPSTFATYDSRKTYDLKPRMRRGRIVYRKSVLDDLMDQLLIRQGKSRKS